jgi:hypothetical protein
MMPTFSGKEMVEKDDPPQGGRQFQLRLIVAAIGHHTG